MWDGARSRPVHILLMEDLSDDVDLTTKALREGKLLHDLHIVTDGVEVMDSLHQRGKYSDAPEPDLILLDLNSPRLF